MYLNHAVYPSIHSLIHPSIHPSIQPSTCTGLNKNLKWTTLPSDERIFSHLTPLLELDHPWRFTYLSLQWRHNERDSVSNHQHHDCLLNRLFSHRSNKTLKLRVTGRCEGKSAVNGEFPAQRASEAEKISTWWRHHVMLLEYAVAQEIISIWK